MKYKRPHPGEFELTLPGPFPTVFTYYTNSASIYSNVWDFIITD